VSKSSSRKRLLLAKGPPFGKQLQVGKRINGRPGRSPFARVSLYQEPLPRGILLEKSEKLIPAISGKMNGMNLKRKFPDKQSACVPIDYQVLIDFAVTGSLSVHPKDEVASVTPKPNMSVRRNRGRGT